MKNSIRNFATLLILFVGLIAYANGDPVMKFSSINRVANPEPLTISEIRIVNEQINITHIDGYNCFDVTYKLKNESTKDFPEIHYGFPIDYLIADEEETYRISDLDDYSESCAEFGWNEKLIKDITFSFNNERLPYHSAKESVREAGFIVDAYEENGLSDTITVAAVNRRWFYTQFSMGPESEALLNVKYKVYANSYVGLYTSPYDFSYYNRKSDGKDSRLINIPISYRYYYDQFDILYDFSPAKHFGNGKPFGINIDIDLSNIADAYIHSKDYRITYYVSRIKRYIDAGRKDIEPINLHVTYRPDQSKESVERLLKRFRIPATMFRTNTKADSITLEFPKPIVISDLACEVDTSKVKSIRALIIYADGCQTTFTYEPQDIKYFLEDRRIKSPVLLTITDLYHDGIAQLWMEDSNINNIDDITKVNVDDDSHKIKSIRLTFETNEPAKSVCKSVIPLDARF